MLACKRPDAVMHLVALTLFFAQILLWDLQMLPNPDACKVKSDSSKGQMRQSAGLPKAFLHILKARKIIQYSDDEILSPFIFCYEPYGSYDIFFFLLNHPQRSLEKVETPTTNS